MTIVTTNPTRQTLFHEQHALASAGGDAEVLREIASLFLADLPRRLDELREAVQLAAFERVAYVAHSLRGSAAVFGSDAAVEATLRLELLAQHRKAEALPAAATEVEFLLRKLAETVAREVVHLEG